MDSALVLRGGQVLLGPHASTAPPSYRTVAHDLLIAGGRIVAIAAEIDAPGVQGLDVSGMVVAPGFVDTHRHNWQAAFRAVAADWTLGQYAYAMHGLVKPHLSEDDLRIAVAAGRAEALASGVTTMVDWAHGITSPAHADGVLAGLLEVPGRSVLAYGGGWGLNSDVPITDELERVVLAVGEAGSDLLTPALGLRGPQYSSMETTARDVAAARRLDIPVTVHGGSAGWGTNRPVAQLVAAGLLDDRTTVVHGNTLADDELRMIADCGASASVSADAEIQMGFGWPATGRLVAAAVRPSLSVDDCAAVGGDMFRAMHTTLVVERGLANAALRDATDREGLALTAADVFEFATVRGAIACGFDDLGTIAVGARADLVVLDLSDLSIAPGNHPVGALVSAGHPGLVRDVLVAGRVVKRAGQLVGIDTGTLTADLIASRDRVLDRIQDATGRRPPMDGGWNPPTTGYASADAHSSR
ncbi:amidohydrolase family protein [Streptomyces chartreusis]|uniref:amidohydrolase family protein n=1 Tax=Streptomyces chartreusis TaxID=1969 RepID=UPI00367C5583